MRIPDDIPIALLYVLKAGALGRFAPFQHSAFRSCGTRRIHIGEKRPPDKRISGSRF